jgi:hypothetical protein
MLCNVQLSDAAVGRVSVIELVPVQQADNVGVLFDRSGLAEVGKVRPHVCARDRFARLRLFLKAYAKA